MRDALADGLQDRQRPLKVRLCAAGHDGKIPRFGADLTARHRRIHPIHPLGKFLGCGHGGGAEVDDHSVLAHARKETISSEHQLLNHVGRRQVDADHASAELPRQLRQGSGAPHSQRDGGSGRAFAAIPHHHVRARRV